ncbi:helix-turn-helix domain-containing protein [Streptomyces sp. DW26H14]|uniref:helix-turn-helix domain-containing protein n=1 Tax=Streptomyces sp. DW26H14 TaxID=3435395 RepID=UPI00403E306E
MLEQPSFGRRLRQLRLQQGKSQAELTGPGMSAAYLSRLESGARRPTDRVVNYLAGQLDVPIESFAEHSEGDLADLVMTLSSRPDGERDTEIRDFLVNALCAATEVGDMTRWGALSLFARQHAALGEFHEEREVLTELTEVSRELNRPALQVHVLQRIARCCRNLGNVEETRQAAREALDLSRQYQLRILASDLVRIKLLLISAEAELGNLAEAARLSAEVCEALPRGSGALAAEAYWTASTVSTRQSNSDRAHEYMRAALESLDGREDLTLWMRLRLAGASLALQAMPPRLREAEALLAEVEPALQLTGMPRHLQELVLLKAQLSFQQGDLLHASELVDSIHDDENLLTFRDLTRFKILRELLADQRGDPHAAHRLRELATEVQAAGMPDLSAEVWRAAAEGAAGAAARQSAAPARKSA